MDLRQTAVNTLSYQLDRAPKLRRAERRQTGPVPRSANVLAAPGPAAGAGRTERWAGLVADRWSSGKTGCRAQPTPSRFPADQGRAARTWSDRIV